MNKKGGSIAIGILVFLTLFILVTTLFYINTKHSELSEDFVENNKLAQVYNKEEAINFYIQDLVEKAASEKNSKEDFISSLKGYLDKSQVVRRDITTEQRKTIVEEESVWIFQELEEIEEQIKKENVELIKNSRGEIDGFKLNLEIKLTSEDFRIWEGESEKYDFVKSVEYKYEKSFFGEF